jgi:hypothetical protein
MILLTLAIVLTLFAISVAIRCTAPTGGLFPPSKIIGENYLSRWHLLPRNRWFNIYLHKFTGSDDDRALHDHPWHSVSFLLAGKLAEVTEDPQSLIGTQRVTYPTRFRPVFRKRSHAHRLILLGNTPAWTLFITGPRKHFAGTEIALWFFHCPNGRQPWYKMTTPDGKQTGGCE